jgi:hypothetical protein
MAWIAVAIGGSALVGLGGAALSSSASSHASDTAANATNNATAANAATQAAAQAQQQKNFDLLQTQESSYRGVGEAAVDPFKQMLNGGYNMQQSPSAAYAMQQGTKQINNSLQTRGLEGNAVQQMGQLGSGVAAADYQTRFGNLLNALNVGTAANAGTASAVNNSNSNLQSGANTVTGANTAAAGQLGNTAMQNGINQQNIIGGAAGQLSGIASNMAGANSGNTSGNWNGSNGTIPGYVNTSANPINYAGGVGPLAP